MTKAPPEIIESYRTAIYEVDAPGAGAIRLRIGERNLDLERLLLRSAVREAAFLTAYNPASVRLCEAENRAAHENLLNELRRRGLRSFGARGVDPTRRWPDEPGFLVLALPRDQAIEIARLFDQNGLVYCGVSVPPELVLVR